MSLGLSSVNHLNSWNFQTHWTFSLDFENALDSFQLCWKLLVTSITWTGWRQTEKNRWSKQCFLERRTLVEVLPKDKIDELYGIPAVPPVISWLSTKSFVHPPKHFLWTSLSVVLLLYLFTGEWSNGKDHRWHFVYPFRHLGIDGRKKIQAEMDSPQTSSLWHPRCVNILECLVTAVFDVAQPRSCQEFLAGFGNAQNRPHGCVARNAVDRVNKNCENAACSSRSSNPQIATSWWRRLLFWGETSHETNPFWEWEPQAALSTRDIKKHVNIVNHVLESWVG